MSGPYLDTGLVLKLVIDEPLSATIAGWLAHKGAPVPYTRLVEVELENTLHAKLFRKEITARQLKDAQSFVRNLLMEGNFFRPDLSLETVLLEALEAMPKTTIITGCRTLDLLHVMSGKILGCSEFLTSDKRQAETARTYGLKVEFFTE
jgi:predicted nucleic acid-binding protein